MTASAYFLSPAEASKALWSEPEAQTVICLERKQAKTREVKWAKLEGEAGEAIVAVSGEAICWLGFADKGAKYLRERFMADWGEADLTEKEIPLMRRALKAKPGALPLMLLGSPFQLEVWRHLLLIPRGTLVRYADIASALNKPKAVRAVGSAVGANPISWLVPCHRVGHSNGSLAGFGWGEACKRRLLGLEIR